VSASDRYRSRNRRIYLTGFMASGKSTIGPILANVLGFDFVDLDKEIAAQEGKTVREIFRQNGESYFRQRERETLTALSQREGIIVALGGGTLGDQESLALATGTGILVYLKIPLEEIVRRLRNKSDRPMVLGRDGDRLGEPELRERVSRLLASREPLYARADLTIAVDQMRVGVTVDRLVHELSPMLR
jgi:shikimate kinase